MHKFNHDDYLQKGPTNGSTFDIELAPMDSMTEHLLSPRAVAFHQQGSESTHSLASPPSLHQYTNANASAHDLYRPGQERSWSPSPAYQSTDGLPQASPAPSIDAHSAHQYPPTHQRQPSSNLLAGQHNRNQSPSPYGHSPAPSLQGAQPQQHARQMSANMLAAGRTSPGPHQAYQNMSPSPGTNQAYNSYGRTSPGPNQAYNGRASPGPNQAYNGRTSPGPNQAYNGRTSPGPAQAYNGRASPGPGQAYAPSPSPQHYQQQQHARQMSGNMLAGGPPSAYAQHQQQHARQMSGNMLAGGPAPNQHARQPSGNMLSSGPRPTINIPPQQHGRSPSGNLLGGQPQQRGMSPVSPASYNQPSPSPGALNASQMLLQQQQARDGARRVHRPS